MSGYESIVFDVAPDESAQITVTLLTGSEFTITNSTEIEISSAVAMQAGDSIRILSFSNHDMLGMRTQIFSGTYEETVVTPVGFDSDTPEVGFDELRFDSGFSDAISRPLITLSRPVTNANYLWITINGTRRFPNSDFILLDPTTVEFGRHLNLTESDVIVVTAFTENLHQQTIGYRIFKNLLNETSYLRISQENSSILASPLHIDDTEISVLDARYLDVPSVEDGIPGVIFINGERITYYEIDLENNKLKRIRRGTQGTGAAEIYPTRTPVFSAGIGQVIPASNDAFLTQRFIYDTPESIPAQFRITQFEEMASALSPDNIQVFVGGILLDTSEYQIDITIGESEPNEILLTLDTALAPGVELMAYLKYSKLWYDITNNPDLSLIRSNTIQSNFLKEKPCFTLV